MSELCGGTRPQTIKQPRTPPMLPSALRATEFRSPETRPTLRAALDGRARAEPLVGWSDVSYSSRIGTSGVRFVESAEVRGAGRPVLADGIVGGADLVCSQHAHPLRGHRLGPGTPQRPLDTCVATRAEKVQRRGNVPQPTKQRLFAAQSLAIVGDGEINGTPSLRGESTLSTEVL